MRYLQNSKCYLSGSIEHDINIEVNWRLEPIKVLTERFGVDVFDPHDDPKQKKAYGLKEAKAAGDWETVRQVASGFVRKDLAQVDRSDFVIARFAYDRVYYKEDMERYSTASMGDWIVDMPEGRLRQVPTTGTIHEIINSDLYHKPTLLICELGIEYIPTWLVGFIPLRYLFGSWDSLYSYLKDVDEGKYKGTDDRWSYTYGLI